MFPLTEPLAAREFLHAVDVDAVHGGAVVGEQGRERAADDLGAVDHHHGVAEQSVAVGQDRVVDVQEFEDLDHGEWGTRQDRLLQLGVVEEADVLVHVEDVLVRQALDVLGEGDAFLEVLILAVVVDRVVDDYTVDVGVVIGRKDAFFHLVLFDFGERVVEATGFGKGGGCVSFGGVAVGVCSLTFLHTCSWSILRRSGLLRLYWLGCREGEAFGRSVHSDLL